MDEVTKARLTKERFEMLKNVADDVCLKFEPYEWYDDGCSYDRSGRVRKMTLEEFNEYITEDIDYDEEFWIDNPLDRIHTDVSMATYESGRGLNWLTFNDYIKQEVEYIFNNKYMDKFYDFEKEEYYSDEYEIAEIDVEADSIEMFNEYIKRNKDKYMSLIRNNISERNY